MIQIFAINKATGEQVEIRDLYWFEENGVHDFGGDSGGWGANYNLHIFIDGYKVYPLPPGVTIDHGAVNVRL